MFDTLGWSDKSWSLKISAASHRIMDYIVNEELRAGHSIIVESNFKYDIDSKRFQKIQATYGCSVVQILCWAEGETVYQRFMGRIDTEARHQGHVEEISAEEIRSGFVEANGKDVPLELKGETIELDTTDTNATNYDRVYKTIEGHLSN